VWAPGPAWTVVENLPPPGFDPLTVQPVASRYTDCAMPVRRIFSIGFNKNQFIQSGNFVLTPAVAVKINGAYAICKMWLESTYCRAKNKIGV
jgi:hypothetical protein